MINFKNLKEVFLEIKKPNAPTSHNVSYFSVSVFKKWNKVFLGLGSNIGDKNKYLDTAILYLKSNYLNILKVSSYYETEPIGFVEQDKFLNSVVMAETLLSPFKLLNYILTIEKNLKEKEK